MNPIPVGMDYLGSLRAEDEPWLVERAFVPPGIFVEAAGNASVVIYGPPGSGLTALRMKIESASQAEGHLTLRWDPTTDPEPQGRRASVDLMGRLLENTAISLVMHLLQHPDAFERADTWGRDFLAAFVQWRLPDYARAHSLRLRRLGVDLSRLQELAIFHHRAKGIELEGVNVEETEKLLLPELRQLGLNGVMVVAEAATPYERAGQQALVRRLLALLDAEIFFQAGGFTYKLLLPMALQDDLAKSRGFSSGRVSQRRLTWTNNQLAELALKRMRLAVGDEKLHINAVYNPQVLCGWLAGCAGTSPRGWLDTLRPILQRYLSPERVSSKPRGAEGWPPALTEEEWLQARRTNALNLVLDKKTGIVTIGLRTISDLSPQELALLTYLYDRPGEVISRQELYYRVYMPYKYGSKADVPIPETTSRVEYETTIDPWISRLRQKVEPEPSEEKKSRKPTKDVFIITYRDKGVALYRQAFSRDG